MINKKRNNNDDDYFVVFKGAKLTKTEANKAGLGIIFGVIGAFVLFFIPVAKSKIVDFMIVLIFAAFGYFWIGNKIFKK